MARKPRIHYEGAIYHVIARGNNKEPIFLQPSDRARYMQLLQRYIQRLDFQLLAYVLMDNHIHLLLRVGLDPLSNVMQKLQLCYTQYFNYKYTRVGHVFQQRYKAYLCPNDSYLLTLVAYIHQNPVRAGLTQGINFPFSSHESYMKEGISIVDTDFVLNILHSDRSAARKQYLDLIRVEQSFPELDEETEFELRQDRLPTGPVSAAAKWLTWEALVKAILAENPAITEEKLLGQCRERKVAAARSKLIFQAVNTGIMTRSCLAQRLGLDLSRITRIVQQGQAECANKSISQA